MMTALPLNGTIWRWTAAFLGLYILTTVSINNALAQTNFCADPVRRSNIVCLDPVPGTNPVARSKTFSLNGRHESAVPPGVFLTWDGDYSVAFYTNPVITLTEFIAGPWKTPVTVFTLSFDIIYRTQQTLQEIAATFKNATGGKIVDRVRLGYSYGGCGRGNIGTIQGVLDANEGLNILQDVTSIDLTITGNSSKGGC
jgi:hypothetical protein